MKKALQIYVFLISILYSLTTYSDNFTKGSNSPIITDTSGNIIISYSDSSLEIDKSIWNKNKAQQVITDFIGYKIDKLFHYRWFKLPGNTIYLYAAYTDNNEKPHNDMFLIDKNSTANRIYHENLENHEDMRDIAIGFYDNSYYMFLYSVQGSGRFLEGELYKKGDLGYLEKVYTLTDQITGSSVKEFENEIIINNGGRVFTFEKNNSEFKIVNYIPKFKYPDLGKNKHILFIQKKYNEFEFYFDNELLAFQNGLDENLPESERFLGKKVINKPHVKIGDEIIIISSTEVYRSHSGTLERKDSVFLTLFVKKYIPEKNDPEEIKEDPYFFFFEFLNEPDHIISLSVDD